MLKLAQATGCRLTKEYAEKTYGVELDDAAAPVNPQGEGGDNQRQQQPAQFSDRSAPVVEADRIVQSAIEKMVGEQAFEAWRGPVEDAISAAFGDLDPEADDLVNKSK